FLALLDLVGSTLFPYTTLFRSILSLLDQLALAEDAVTRKIVAQVDVLAQGGHARVARLRDSQQRTGPGICLTEAQEIKGRLCGKDRKSTRLNSSHVKISYAVFC